MGSRSWAFLWNRGRVVAGIRRARERRGVALCGGWFGLRVLVKGCVTCEEGGVGRGATSGVRVAVLLGVRRPEATTRALGADVDAVDKTGRRHVEGLYYRCRERGLPLSEGHERSGEGTKRWEGSLV